MEYVGQNFGECARSNTLCKWVLLQMNVVVFVDFLFSFFIFILLKKISVLWQWSFLGEMSPRLLLFVWDKKYLPVQRAKKVVSDSPGLVDFAIGLVNSDLHLPDGQVQCSLRNSPYRRTVKSKILWVVEMTFGLVNVSFSLPEWQAVKMTFFAPCCICYVCFVNRGFVWFVDMSLGFTIQEQRWWRCMTLRWLHYSLKF